MKQRHLSLRVEGIVTCLLFASIAPPAWSCLLPFASYLDYVNMLTSSNMPTSISLTLSYIAAMKTDDKVQLSIHVLHEQEVHFCNPLFAHVLDILLDKIIVVFHEPLIKTWPL